MESANAKIEMLRGDENWLQWRFVMRTLLGEDDDLINVCEGNLCHPGRKPLNLVLCCTTAHEMWKKLNTVYDMKSDENLNMVQEQFFDLKWEESENVSYNLSKLELIAAKMKALGSEIGEKMLITRILSVLPYKFDHFHSAWDSVEEEKKTLDRLSTRLMTEEISWKKDDQETSVVLEPRNQNRDHSGIGLLGNTSAIQADVWIIDSGAMDHMTERREWFSVFEEFDNTMIEIDDGTFMDACGKGKIKVETFVDGKWVTCTMNDVLYVPAIERSQTRTRYSYGTNGYVIKISGMLKSS
ncbi:uncharacterized protein LOC117239900 [Bombus vosnesenskii]|uniref:Uncharacterized protein LOC117239810 n=1 Tax=Bombus vosnesenskii TaxID=207650 RepID=A0A6J3L8I3_9HYME|nr:uncharacterized protein LOC117239810 [Bombus vosnesenskii]XP_033361620.1 uncharacterized protein LOC117239896 [Bombus vosnesenskii]XP_033361624.1 uncharacterized protein LOC117239900 [Bombus vosnesenskii]